MKKIVLFVLLLLLPFISPLRVQAVNYWCSFIPSPFPVNQDSGDLTITVKSSDLPSGKYDLYLNSGDTPGSATGLQFNDGEINTTFKKPSRGWWPSGDASLKFIRTDSSYKETCTGKITIQESSAQPSCSINIYATQKDANGNIVTPPTITPDSGINISVNGIKEADYDIYVDNNFKNRNHFANGSGAYIGTYSPGNHTVQLKDGGRAQCTSGTFSVYARGSTGAGGSGSGTSKPLDLHYCTSEPGQIRIDTAIGCIPINTSTDFTAWILGWFIGIAGGIAFLLMVWSGFQIMTAGGNPDQVKAGQEQLTAAISGLILIIFSVFLLKLIGVQIFQIPGLI